jgi:small subunit ribosomal protein S17
MKTLVGVVLSTKMTKSAVVEVAHAWTHPKYKKTITKTKKYIVHNELDAKKDDKVELTETRPMSRLKRFAITKIIESN